ncbi:hypothetical protein [Actimicrobium antarcticum]
MSEKALPSEALFLCRAFKNEDHPDVKLSGIVAGHSAMLQAGIGVNR